MCIREFRVTLLLLFKTGRNVADSNNHRIQVFRYSDGTHLRSFGNGQFNFPWSITFDYAGHIVVSEFYGHRLQVLRYSDGAHVRTIGSFGSGNGQFNYPKGIAVDGNCNARCTR
jgi:hypothetical protein